MTRLFNVLFLATVLMMGGLSTSCGGDDEAPKKAEKAEKGKKGKKGKLAKGKEGKEGKAKVTPIYRSHGGGPYLSGISESDGDGIKTVIRKKKGQVQFCFEQAVSKSGAKEGRLELKLTIDKGAVSGVKVAQNTTGDTGIDACVTKKAERWRFPETVGADKPVTITVPYSLSSE